MKNNFIKPHLDFVGFSASMLCAIHCAALPIGMTAGAVGGMAWLENPLFEGAFIIASIGIAGWSLSRSYWLHHHQWTALKIVAVGFLLLLAGRFIENAWEIVLTVAGGITIATAHWVNWRLSKNCKQCVHH